jgi:hypothetical protein
MMGSGTVVAIARSLGHRAIGIDIDPLSALNAAVWTTPIAKGQVLATLKPVLVRARQLVGSIRASEAFPPGADAETIDFLKYWFDRDCRRELLALTQVIFRLRSEPVKRVFWTALSRMIIAKDSGVSLARDLSHSRPHKVYQRAPTTPFEQLAKSVEHVVRNCIDVSVTPRGPRVQTSVGDARKIELPSESVDVIVTSPPYLNAIDYMRCSKFSLVWMGYTIPQLRQIRARSIGTEIGTERSADVTELFERSGIALDESRSTKMIVTFARDMVRVLSEVRRVLVRGGTVIMIVGESTVRGKYIPTARLISLLGAKCGLRRVRRTTRLLPPNRRYLPPPNATSGQMSDRMSREVILTLTRA